MYNVIICEYLINYKYDGKFIESCVVKSFEDFEKEMMIVYEMVFVNFDEDFDV